MSGRRLVLVGLVLLLTGCGRRQGSDQVTLRVWAMGREGEVVRELLDGFADENPDIRIDLQQIPWTAAHEKLLTAFVGRATPDLAQLGNTWIAEFVALRALEPLDRWLTGPATGDSASARGGADSTAAGRAPAAGNSRPATGSRAARTGPPSTGRIDSTSFFPGIWHTNQINGVTYGIPWYVDTRVLFYRTDILAQAGYDSIPMTWQGWRASMEAVKKVVGPDRYAIILPVNEWNQPIILGLQAGSPLLVDHDTRGAFSQEAYRRAFTFYIDLFRDGLAPPVRNNEIANVYQEFGRGTFAMYLTGPWNLGEFAQRLPADLQDSWTTSPLPGPTGAASGVSLAGGSSLVIFKRSRHKESAWRLVEYLSRPEQQVRFYELSGDLPASRPAWQEGQLARQPRARAFWEQLQRVVPTPKIPEWEQIAMRMQDYAEAAARGVTPVDSALARADRDVDRILQKRRWLLEHGHLPGSGRDGALP